MKDSTFKRRAHAVFVGLLFAGAGLVPVLAISAATAGSASGSEVLPPGGGYLEICKIFATPPAADASVNTGASFGFAISGDGLLWVPAGSCSAPRPEPAGPLTVTENVLPPWYAVGSIVETLGHGLTGTNLATGVANVTISSGATETLTYTNDLVTGYLKICKVAGSSNLTGSFTFNVSGEDDYSGSTTVQTGGCSDPLQVPAGKATVTEAGTNLYVTGIVATINGNGANALVGSPDLVTGTATVGIKASADNSTETVLTYTNDVVGLKVCKVWDGKDTIPTAVGEEFPFTVTPAAGSVLGPVPAPYSFSLLAGTATSPVCSSPVDYRAGTVVSITEGIVPGSKVESIATDGNGESVVTGYPSLTGRTTEIVVGTPVT
ncbi:MAG TPA: hypothetical protein VED84_02140, partial [Acidimicrobiales bacterium]|nr:hypothetical protein [Acidimicrobiales bacterium]